MAYNFKGWFIFEEGDTVQLITTAQKGIVVERDKLDIEKRTQTVFVQFKNKTVCVSNKDLELVRRTVSHR
jgi:hypothetical protein